MTTLIGKAVRWLGYGTAIFIILAATAVSISQLLAPWLNEHRADFAKWASDLLNMPITIQQVSISWRRGEPELELQQVAVLNKQTRQPTFEIQKLKINLKLIQSVWQRKPVPEAIRIYGVHLTLRQKKSGQLRVQGLDNFVFSDNFTGAAVAGNAMGAWIFSQPDLALRHIEIQFIPEAGPQRSVTLASLDLHNTKKDHVLKGSATLNQAMPTQVTIALQWQGDTFDIMNSTSRTQLYLYLESVALPQWISQQAWQKLQVKQGVGSGKFWITWEHGQLQQVQSQFQLYEMQLQALITKKIVIIPRINGHLSWKREGERQLITGEDILIDFPQHLWPTTQFSLTLLPENSAPRPPLKRKMGGYVLQVGYLDLADSKELALASGLLPEAMQKLLLDLNPKGEVRSLALQSEDAAKPEDNVGSAEFSGLTLNAWQKFPGLMNVGGSISWSGNQGKLILNGQQTTMTLNSIFAKPLQFDTVAGNIQWQQEAIGTWVIVAKNFQVHNADITVNADMTIRIPQHASPVLNLTGSFSVPHAAQIENYLPVKTFEPPFVKWLHNRFQGGQIASGTVTVQGKLSDFPFDNGTGKLLIRAAVKDLEFEYAPGWPAIHHLYGKLVFSGHAMTADMESAQIFNVPLSKVHGNIPYIGPAHPQILNLQAVINADLAEGLRFIQQSPLRDTLGKDLSGMQLAGAMGLNLAFIIPVKTPEKSQVTGDVKVSAAVLQLPDWHLTLDQLAGTLHFTEKTLQTQQMQGRLFHEAVNLTINTVRLPHAPPVVKAILQSKIALPALQEWLTMPLAHFLQGATTYTAELDIISHQYPQPSQLLIHSNLKGLTINLPDTYAKKANETRDFQLSAKLKQGQSLQAKVEYGKLVIKVTPEEKDWQVAVTSPEMSGHIWFPGKNSTAIIQAKFSHLYLTFAENKQALDPKTLPAFSFVGDDVRLHGNSLGRVALDVVPVSQGLRIQKLSITTDYSALSANGEWLSQKNKYQTDLQGKLTTKNVSKLLDHWGLGSANLIAGEGNITFDLIWSDIPYKPALASMSGDIALHLGKGRVINLGNSTDAKMGFGRMLNILSLQTLPRRLSLDFTDLFEKGYSFDTMQGHFILDNGNAVTKDTYFDGPIARIEIKGRVGLAVKDYDLILSVTPYVTGSIPIVATLAGGPLVGAVTWLVEKVASSAVSKVTTYHYFVTGPWDNPVWAQTKAK